MAGLGTVSSLSCKICEVTGTFAWMHRTGKDFLDPGVQVTALADSGIVAASFTLVDQSPSTDLSHKLILASSMHVERREVPHKGLMPSSSETRGRVRKTSGTCIHYCN